MKIVREEERACPLQAKFATARRELSEALIERDSEIDLTLTGLVARENVLLVGPPGCAKSLLLDSLMAWMKGRKFSILLNRFTTPETPALWTTWPLLPVVRRHADGGYDCGLMYDCRGAPRLAGLAASDFICNLFMLPRTLD